VTEKEKEEKIWLLIAQETDQELERNLREDDRQEGEISIREFMEITGLTKYKANKILHFLVEKGKASFRRGYVNKASGYWWKLLD